MFIVETVFIHATVGATGSGPEATPGSLAIIQYTPALSPLLLAPLSGFVMLLFVYVYLVWQMPHVHLNTKIVSTGSSGLKPMPQEKFIWVLGNTLNMSGSTQLVV